MVATYSVESVEIGEWIWEYERKLRLCISLSPGQITTEDGCRAAAEVRLKFVIYSTMGVMMAKITVLYFFVLTFLTIFQTALTFDQASAAQKNFNATRPDRIWNCFGLPWLGQKLEPFKMWVRKSTYETMILATITYTTVGANTWLQEYIVEFVNTQSYPDRPAVIRPKLMGIFLLYILAILNGWLQSTLGTCGSSLK